MQAATGMNLEYALHIEVTHKSHMIDDSISLKIYFLCYYSIIKSPIH